MHAINGIGTWHSNGTFKKLRNHLWHLPSLVTTANLPFFRKPYTNRNTCVIILVLSLLIGSISYIISKWSRFRASVRNTFIIKSCLWAMLLQLTFLVLIVSGIVITFLRLEISKRCLKADVLYNIQQRRQNLIDTLRRLTLWECENRQRKRKS